MEKEKHEAARPCFPKRAVVTAGMPYGNKELHFGHVGGMFVHADTFARFLRDRIGKENVIFLSGTDCYGSPILESYRKLVETQGGAKDSGPKQDIREYVEQNHRKQKQALEYYGISLDYFGASALSRAGEIHTEVSAALFHALYDKGYLQMLNTAQFYDPDFHVLLNGRQVVGRCPIEGCCSDKAYAEECALGHQYMPAELIDPKSTLSQKTPEIREVKNWYFNLEQFEGSLRELVGYWKEQSQTRKYILKTMEEFLKPPAIYVQKKLVENLEALEQEFPSHETVQEEKKASYTFVFKTLGDRDKARKVLTDRGIFYRTGKTLVPFRLSGNIDWGVPVPEQDGAKGLTFWVWPESLWAPVSFLRAYLEEKGLSQEEWKNWWEAEDAQVYQFIGEDNIYFYGITEMALFGAWKTGPGRSVNLPEAHLPYLVANRHVLFMDTKASSSSDIKPPMAEELLQYYTAEQLRMHFLSLGLSGKSTGFKPQVYLPENEQTGVDPVLKEGNLLTNVFNRLLRSCLYMLQKYDDSLIPCGNPSGEILNASREAVLEYERHMYRHDFHRITYVLDSYIRLLNKRLAGSSKEAETDSACRFDLLTDCFYGIKTALLLLHPVAPSGCEMAREYLGFSEKVWNWEYAFAGVADILQTAGSKTKFLAPRVDFFKKHECQLPPQE